MKFDLETLNDYEFERLCKDILEKKKKMRLHTFSRGKDEGIDISDSEHNPTVIGQVKHYYKSSFSQLLTSLKKEEERIEGNSNLKEYYVFTSQSLTRKNKEDISKMFSKHMKDISFVIDAVDINDFLSKKENSNILNKHYKLWLCASNVLSRIYNQNVFIDCDQLIDEIEKEKKFYVQTNAFREAMNKLNKDSIIIIIGNPGVGKSTLSKMLLLKFADEDYSVRYTTDNDIGNIKNTLSTDPEKKEIVLLDDFLGQHYLKIKENQPNEIKTLISFVRRNKNKKIILNSRITILNEAAQTSIVFNEMMERENIHTYLIDMDKMSNVEKAEILYNHLYFNEIPPEYFAQIRVEKRYYKIVRHKNYNPRIIEYVTKPKNYSQVEPEKYFDYIMKKLDYPEDVWKDEYRNRMCEEDRILVNILYSLTDTKISKVILEKAYNNRVKNENINSSNNLFENACTRLTNSLLRNVEDKNVVNISTINPSVNDFLRTNMMSNAVEKEKIIDNAVFIEQILKVSTDNDSKEYVKKKIIDKSILDLQSINNSVEYYFIKLVAEFNICSLEIKNEVQKCFQDMHKFIVYSEKAQYENLLLQIINDGIMEYYNLEPMLQDMKLLNMLIKHVEFNGLRNIFMQLIKKGVVDKNQLKDNICILSGTVIEKIENKARGEVEDYLYDVVNDELNNCEEVDVSTLEESVSEKIEDMLYEEIEDLIYDMDELFPVSIDDFDLSYLVGFFDIEGAIKEQIEQMDYDDFDWDDFDTRTESDAIAEIFER